MKILKRTLCIAAACCAFASAVSKDTCSASEKTVKVGYYYDNEGFQKGFSDNERKSGYAYDYYQEIARYTGWKYEYIYGSFDEIISGLENGSIDLCAGISKNSMREGKFLFPEIPMGTEFSGINELTGAENDDFYLAVSKKSPELLKEINETQEEIFSKDPYFCAELFDKYFKKAVTADSISAEGRKWLSSHDTIKIGFLDNYMPYCDMNTKTKETNGAMVSMFTEISHFLSKSISAVRFSTYSELQSALENGEIDAVFPAYHDFWSFENQDSTLSDTFLSDRMVTIYKEEYDDSIFKKAAVLSNSPVQELFISVRYPETELVYYPDVYSCLKAVKKGEVSSFICESSVVNYCINENPGFSSLKQADFDEKIEYCFAVTKDNTSLCNVLDTALRSLNSEELRKTVSENLNSANGYTVIDFIKHNFVRFAVITVISALIIILTLTKYRRLLSRKQKEVETAKQEVTESKQETVMYRQRTEYDHLTGVFSRGHFIEQASAKIKSHRPNDVLRLVMLDIDNFKSVNDTYGHDNGDTVLIRLGEILKEISRVNGFAGRFGGEEFMIFLFGEDTSIQAHIINQVCKKLRETDFSFTDRHITLSVGVTDISNGDTFEECLERADKALYYSKQNGKNQVNWYEEVIDKK